MSDLLTLGLLVCDIKFLLTLLIFCWHYQRGWNIDNKTNHSFTKIWFGWAQLVDCVSRRGHTPCALQYLPVYQLITIRFLYPAIHARLIHGTLRCDSRGNVGVNLFARWMVVMRTDQSGKKWKTYEWKNTWNEKECSSKHRWLKICRKSRKRCLEHRNQKYE